MRSHNHRLISDRPRRSDPAANSSTQHRASLRSPGERNGGQSEALSKNFRRLPLNRKSREWTPPLLPHHNDYR